MLNKKIISTIFALSVACVLTGCETTTDAGLTKATQCNNLRNELWQIQSNPQKFRDNIATRQYNNMRLEYGYLNCGDFRDYFKN